MKRQRLAKILMAAGLVGVIGGGVTEAVRGQQVIIGGGGGVMQPFPAVVGGPGGPGGPGGAIVTSGGVSAAAQLSAIKIIEKSEFRQVITVARDCIKDKAWEEGVTALQALLDHKEDHYVQVRDKDAAGKEMLRWTSVKFEANNLLGSMPADGLAVYEVRYGNKAKDRLDTAKKRGDREMLADVAQRYCHTRAGIEANELLATLFLARGQNFMAALRYEKLLAMDPARTNLSDLTLYKAALAFRRVGDEKNGDAAWKKLEGNLQAAGGMRVGDDMVPMARLKQLLAEEVENLQASPFEWAMIRGDQRNNAQAGGSPPLLDTVLWRRTLLQDKYEQKDKATGQIKLIGEPEPQAAARIDQAIKDMRKHDQPILSGFFPIATKGMLIYRTHSGIRAVAIKEVTHKGRQYKPGEIVWNSYRFSAGLANLLDQNTQTKNTIETWLDGQGGLMPPQPNVFPGGFVQPGMNMSYFKSGVVGVTGVLYENSTIGTLATDHQFIYAIDDLSVPPPFGYNANPYMPQQNNLGEVRKYVTQNTLMAFSIERGGKLEWDLGGSDDPQFADTHFLGVPIAIGGKLYVLNEKNPPNNTLGGESELRLVCIDPTKKTPQGHPAIVEPIQMLGMVQAQSRVAYDISRRTNAVHLAFGEGILVCPTNAGEVFGVDLMSRSLVWSYPYREQAHVSPFQMNVNFGMPIMRPGGIVGGPVLGSSTLANWKTAPPAIVEGKVVFTAPDGNSVHCINLRDGTPVWRSAQIDGDLYMAGVYSGKVLIVGKTSIRALSLATGQRLWSIPTGAMPSGQGIASKNVYYLPLSQGEILAVDIEHGTIKAHNRAAGDAAKTPPGNLVFYEGSVLSLTPTDVVAYPQLAARLDEATVALKADPENLEKLTNHGELLLKDGQVQSAVADLEKVLAKKPDGAVGQRAKDRMYEALTDLLHANFNDTSGKYLDLYKELTTAARDDQEKQQRQARYFRIVGQGREAQGNLVEAFQMYKDFGALPIHSTAGGIASLDDPSHKVPVNVWLRGRVSAMIARATAEQKAPLEAKITEEWQQVVAKKDLDAIRSFVGMFDVPFEVGRLARLHLAEAIIERNDRPAFLEAEMILDQLRTPSLRNDSAITGRALAALALLEEKKGTADSMKLAATYYRELSRAFAKVEVRKGKTGADLFNDLAADKRFLPYLEEAASTWGPVKMGARKLGPGGFAAGQSFMMVPEGDLTPFATQHRLVFDPNNPVSTQVRLVDVGTGKERWAQNVGQVAGNNQVFFALYQQNNVAIPYSPHARHRFYHVKGHLIVAQIGVTAYCFDGDNGKVLWSQPLVEGLQNQPNTMIQPAGIDADGNPEFLIFNPAMPGQNRRLTLGQVGAAQASYVALLTQKGLLVNDPLRGNLLWSKMDVDSGSRVFGDEEFIFLVTGSDGDGMRAGQVLRAIDGAVQEKIPDFGPVYQNRIQVHGRRILAAAVVKNELTLRLYDIVVGKNIWSKKFDAACTVLRTDDPSLTGVIDPKGNVTVLNAATGDELLTGNVIHRKVAAEDLKGLQNPLLVADADRVYIALNKPLDLGKLAGGTVHNNFANGLRCYPINGWVVALHRKDGVAKIGGDSKPFKKGDFAWHSFAPLHQQMLVLEQFDQLPVLIFSSRYNEPLNGGINGFRWLSYTQSISKHNGKFVYDEGPDNTNSVPQFYAFNVDPRAGTINMIGQQTIVQHYIDDGRKLPAVQTSTGATFAPGQGALPSRLGMPAVPGNVIMPAVPPVIRINGNIQVQPVPVPLPVVPPPAPPKKE
jgi:outer membrane protein assembly factor BamB/tetratricopeptide (TPR) repeat protein